MFNEILRIKPVMDDSAARQMEQGLSSRFARVASRFGQGLKSVIKGSFLGISLGLISKLLNPIEELEEKIKKLLGEGTDIREMADKFGTTPGQLRMLQDVSQTLGVTPDHFKDMLSKYAQAIEKGREELANPFTERSETTNALKQFIEEKDIVKSFTQFLTSLKAAGQGSGTTIDLGHGEKRTLTGMEARQRIEKDVFGEVQTGAARKLIEANIPEVAKTIREPGVDILNRAINKSASLADQQRALDVQNQTQDFIAATNKLNGKMIQDMAKGDQAELSRQTKQLESFEDLKKASLALDEVKGLMTEANNFISKGIGYLADLASFVGGLKQNRLLRGILGKGD